MITLIKKITIKHLFTTFFAICSMLHIPSCKSNDPDVPDKEKSDVTVMIYGAGGGSLDRSMIGKFRQLYRADAEAYKHVQIAVQFKFSDDDRMPNWRSEEEQKTF